MLEFGTLKPDTFHQVILKEIFLYSINSSGNVFNSNTSNTLSFSCFAIYLISAFISFPVDNVNVKSSPISACFAVSLFKTVAI